MTGYPVQTVNNDEDENDDDGDDVEERRDRGYAKHRYQADVTRVARDLATFRLATQTPYNAFPSEWNRVVSPELDDTQGNKSPQIWCLVTILSEGFRSEIYHHSCTFTLSSFFFFLLSLWKRRCWMREGKVQVAWLWYVRSGYEKYSHASLFSDKAFFMKFYVLLLQHQILVTYERESTILKMLRIFLATR